MPDNSSATTSMETFLHALLALDRVTADRIFRETDAHLPQVARIEQLIVPALAHIGASWEAGEVSLAQVYMSGRLCEEMVDRLLPPADPRRTDYPPMAIAVLEDYHFLGLRLVYSALRAGGFSLLNYGRCDVEHLVQQVIADRIRFLLISTLMLPSALRVKQVRAALHAAGHAVTIIVGGAPYRFDPDLAHEVGADATGASAGEAAVILRRLIAEE